MRFRVLGGTLLVLGFLVGCDDSTGPGGDDIGFNDLSGEWTGEANGEAFGYTYNSTWELTVTQSGGDLSGPWSAVGFANGPGGQFPYQGDGPFVGTVAAGNNPAVVLTFSNADCPQHSNAFAGSYSTANQRISVSGSADLLGEDCSIIATVPVTVVVER